MARYGFVDKYDAEGDGGDDEEGDEREGDYEELEV